VFLLSNAAAPEANLVRMAAAAGIERIVKHSVWGAADEAFSFARWHRPTERQIEEALAPHLGEMRRRIELGLEAAAVAACEGIVAGLYRCQRSVGRRTFLRRVRRMPSRQSRARARQNTGAHGDCRRERTLWPYASLGTQFAAEDFQRCHEAFRSGLVTRFQGRGEEFAHGVAQATAFRS
jgi:hypothetical protein